ncbi:hypothetical protein EWI07_08950 [Sporolactobacillus sp. THM7-4]|nr:hypothetical protein EWI07_08950 [Sporolactobacillus sp. THM7-4]
MGILPMANTVQTQFILNGSMWVSYDSRRSVAVKGKYAVDHNWGGAMFWEYALDGTGVLLDALFNGVKGTYTPNDTVLNAPVAAEVEEGQSWTSGARRRQALRFALQFSSDVFPFFILGCKKEDVSEKREENLSFRFFDNLGMGSIA